MARFALMGHGHSKLQKSLEIDLTTGDPLTQVGLTVRHNYDGAFTGLAIDNDSEDTAATARWYIASGTTQVAMFAAHNRSAAIVTNGPTGAQSVLRNIGNYPMVFGTNNIERMRIFGDGTVTIYDDLTVSNTGGQNLILKDDDTSGSNATSYMGFHDSLDARKGYVGNSISGTDAIVLASDVGDIQLEPSARVEVTSGTGIYGDTGVDFLHLDAKEVFDAGDGWLRVNANEDFTNGTFFPGSNLQVQIDGTTRCDGGITLAANNAPIDAQTESIDDDATATFNVPSYCVCTLVTTYNRTTFAHFGVTTTQAPEDLGSGSAVSMGAVNPDIDTNVNIWPSSSGVISIKNRLGSTRQFTLYHFGV